MTKTIHNNHYNLRQEASDAVEVISKVYREAKALLDAEVVEDTLAAAVNDKAYYHSILEDSLKSFEDMFRDLRADLEDFKRAVIGTRSFEVNTPQYSL